MFQRALLLLALGSALGVLFATFLGPTPVHGEEVPAELKSEPAQPTRSAKDISRPIIRATKKVRPAVVKIVNYQVRFRGQRPRPVGSGSGFIISEDGHVLTNRHVIENQRGLVVELADGRIFDKVKVLGADPRSDVAVLRISGPFDKLPVARMGDSDALEVGEIVVAIGAPYNLGSSVSMGVVSATGRTGVIGRNSTSEEFIQTDAALNSGNSGGPLVNLDGQVVGINTAIHGATGANVGVGFSIPINLARSVAASLIERGVAKRGWLGIVINPNARPLTKRELKQYGVDAQAAIRITGTQADSPASRAGLQAGDLVSAVDGKPLKDIRLLHARLAQAGPGGTVVLTVHNDGNTRDVKVRLAEEKIYSFGIEVRTLDDQRRRDLELPPGTTGVEVTRILENSAAARTDKMNRLLPGDVIVGINWRGGRAKVANQGDFDTVMTHFLANPPRVIQFVIRTKEGVYVARLRPDGNY